jgi:hypothetical protein
MIRMKPKKESKHRRRYEAKKQNQLLLCQAVTSLFPVAKLKKPKDSIIGNSNKDYGGRYGSLNFPPVAPVKMGYVIIGFAYDTDQKLETYGIPNGRICCQLSTACRTYMEAVKAAFLAQYSHVIMGEALKTMRISGIVGARTKCHTDAYRGRTHNYMLCHGEGCQLRVYQSPWFHCSVVLFRGHHFIPMSYSEQSQCLRMYGADPEDPAAVVKYEFRNMDKHLSALICVGTLPYVVVGVIGGLLQIDTTPANGHKAVTIAKPSSLPTVSFSSAVATASLPHNAFPRIIKNTTYITGKADRFIHFEAWKLRHEFVGSDPFCERSHVFFRLIRQSPTSEHYIRVDGLQNFISMDSAELVYQYGTLENNVIENVLQL